MTVSTTSGGGEVVPYEAGDSWGDVGLEDVGVSDVVIPRLSIVHDEGIFRDNLSKAEYPTLKVILLGLVKQRIFWADDMDDGDKPLCKSPDFEHGFPNMRDDVKPDKQFPWPKSNFEPSQAVPIEIDPSAKYPQGYSSNGLGALPCASCVFKDWDKGDWKVPPCTEQHTYPLLYNPDGDGQVWTPALLSLQKTGIKPSRQYISSFAQSKQPMFTVFTELSLNRMSRGSVKYSVPVLKRREATDRESWGEYADSLRSIREFVRSAPRRLEEDGEPVAAPSANVNTGPTAAAPAAATAAAPPASPVPSPSPSPATAAAPSAPVAPTSASVAADDDDLPF